MVDTVTDKRLRNEIKDLKKNKLDFAQAYQDENDKFLFYFLLIGDVDTEDPKDKEHTGQYKGGYYMGKIILPPNYPEKPGDFVFITPSGRFKVGQKICLSNTGYHSESWSPVWSVRNMLLGLISIFFSDKQEAQGANHLQMKKADRLKLAQESVKFNIDNHFNIFTKFDQFIDEFGNIKPREPKKEDVEEQAVNPPKPVIKVTKDPDIEKQDEEEKYINNIIEQLKKKDEEEEMLKKQEDDKYMEDIIKQIEENEQKELNNNKNAKTNDNNEFFIVDEPDEVVIEKPKKVIKKNDVISKIEDSRNAKIKVVNQKVSKQTRIELANQKIEIIKKMTRKTYDYKIFKEVQNLMGLNLNEL